MRKRDEADLELDVQAAAYLAGEDRTQRFIAKAMGKSTPIVSRLLQIARQEGWLEQKFKPGDLTEEQMRAVRERASAALWSDALRRVLEQVPGPSAPQIRVLPSRRGTWDARLDGFGEAAASCVRDLTLQSKTGVGVTWGVTIASIVRGIDRLPAVHVKKRIQFVPLCPEPLGLRPTLTSSSNLAAQMDRVINGRTDNDLSLAVVPAMIPLSFSASETAAIWKMVRLVDSYRRIFGEQHPTAGDPPPHVDCIDTILTSVSSPERGPLGFINDEIIRRGRVDRRSLEGIVLGDIGGVLIPRPGLSAEAKAEYTRIQQHWTGLKVETLKRCRDAACSGHGAGVIVVAVGASKARFVLDGVIKQGLANHIIIDEELKKKLEDIVANQPARKPQP